MGSAKYWAVLAIGFTVAYEHPEPRQNLAFNDVASFVIVTFVPDVLRNTFH